MAGPHVGLPFSHFAYNYCFRLPQMKSAIVSTTLFPRDINGYRQRHLSKKRQWRHLGTLLPKNPGERGILVNGPNCGEVWWGEIESVGRRPFLVMTRSGAIAVLNSVICAPVTRTIRNIPTELLLDVDEGMPNQCAASFDNLRVIPKANLVSRICVLEPARLTEACSAH